MIGMMGMMHMIRPDQFLVNFVMTQDVVCLLTNPIKHTGHIGILRGNFAPGSMVKKITGAESIRFNGTARCFNNENSVYLRLMADEIKPGIALIFRY